MTIFVMVNYIGPLLQIISLLMHIQSLNFTAKDGIEIFFKWIKQHLHIKTFYSRLGMLSTQMWIALFDFRLLIS